jgi:hypothetical protein
MKKHQLGIWLGLCAATTIFEIAALSTPANAQNCSAYDSSVVASLRQRNVSIGNILINNNYGPDPQAGAVSIRLYHPDAPDRIFSTWSFAGGESANLATQGQRINIGGDWGIQIVFGNGVTSCIYPVADVGRFENVGHVVTATNIYRSNTSSGSGISSSGTNVLSAETSSEVRGGKGPTNMGGGWAEASGTFYRNGLLVVEGHSRSDSRTSGTYAQIFVVGVDSRGRSLFVSNLFDMPTACSLLDTCSSERRTNFQQQVNSDLAQYVAKVDVYVADRSGGRSAREAFKTAITESCAAYDDLPVAARAAIAFETGFAGCNP